MNKVFRSGSRGLAVLLALTLMVVLGGLVSASVSSSAPNPPTASDRPSPPAGGADPQSDPPPLVPQPPAGEFAPAPVPSSAEPKRDQSAPASGPDQQQADSGFMAALAPVSVDGKPYAPGMSVTPGGNVDYQITLTPTGGQASHVALTGSVVNGTITNRGAGISGAGDTGFVINQPTLTSTQVYLLTVRAGNTGSLTLTAQKTSHGIPQNRDTLKWNKTAGRYLPCEVGDKCSASVNIADKNQSHSVKKEVKKPVGDTVNVGDEVQYVVTFTNAGENNLTNVFLNDPLDSRLEYVNQEGSSQGIKVNQTGIGLTISSLASQVDVPKGKSVQAVLNMRVKSGLPGEAINNTVLTTGDGGFCEQC